MNDGAPRGPASILLAGLGGLAAFALVVVIGLLGWFLALRPEPGESAGRPGLPTLPTETTPTETTPTETTPAPSPEGEAQFTFRVCRRVQDGECTRPFRRAGNGSFVVPARTTRFYAWLAVAGSKQGDRIDVRVVDRGSRREVDRGDWKLGGPEWRVWFWYDGPFQPTMLDLVYSYNGREIDFSPPVVISIE